jgi:hypothetical protein
MRAFRRAPQQILQRQRAAALAISIALLSSLFANSGAEAVVPKAKEARLVWRRGLPGGVDAHSNLPAPVSHNRHINENRDVVATIYFV